MKVIEKKIQYKFLVQIVTGRKRFELRKEDDVKYEKGDLILLRAIDVKDGSYLPDCEAVVEVLDVLRDFEGLKDGYCICSIKVLSYV